MIFIVFTCIIIGVCISLYGWGLLLHRLARHPSSNWVVTITIGLGAIIFLGGVLNLLRFAYGWAFDILLVIGAILAIRYYKSKPKLLVKSKSEWLCLAVSGLLIAAIMYFTIQTQLRPKVFNAHDDFEKYFAHPVRMLQTGTLFGSPLSALGSETLGGQAVLHGIVLNHFPISYINGVDAVFGLLLCLLLSVSILPPRTAFLPMSLVSLLVVFFINPQYVNISALYTGSIFVMASIMLVCDSSENKNNKTENLPSPVLLGSIYAALIALKPIFAVFPVLHVSFLTIALALSGVEIRRVIRWSAFTATWSSLFLLPWLLLYLPHYMHTSHLKIPQSTIIAASEHLDLLSTKPLPYRSSFAHYTFIVTAISVCVLGVLLWKCKEPVNSSRIALAGLASSGGTVVAAYLLIISIAPKLNGYTEGVRYTIPFLIAGAPIILAFIYIRAIRENALDFKLFFSTISLLFGIIILVIFSKSLTKRIHQAYENGSILAFSSLVASPEYIGYNEEVLDGQTRTHIIEAQEQVPAGQAIVVWVDTPFYLDYKRNSIFDVEPAGLASPWAYIPDANYFLIEYSGFAVRSFEKYLERTIVQGRRERYIAERCISFLQSLQEIRQNADEIYNDGKIVVFKKHGK